MSKPKGTSIVQLLDCMAKGFDEKENKSSNISDEESALKLIESFSIGRKKKGKQVVCEKKQVGINYVGGNQEVGADASLKYELRNQLKFPGVNRFQMPEIPSKSQGLRKL